MGAVWFSCGGSLPSPPWFTVLLMAWVLCGLAVGAWSPSPLVHSANGVVVLVAAWVLCGLGVAAWLVYKKHSLYVNQREEALGVWCKERALMLQQLVLTHVGQMQVRLVEWVILTCSMSAPLMPACPHAAAARAHPCGADAVLLSCPPALMLQQLVLTHVGQMQVRLQWCQDTTVVLTPCSMGSALHPPALMLQQLVLTHVGQMQVRFDWCRRYGQAGAEGQVCNTNTVLYIYAIQLCYCLTFFLPSVLPSHAQTLTGIISVMGKPGRRGKWELDTCLNGSTWEAYLTRTAYARPGNTGATACVFVRDAERSAFERQYGSIRDNTKNVSAHRPIYCPKILDFSTVVALNGSWNIDPLKRFRTEIPLLVAGKPLYTWPYPMGSPPDHTGFGLGFPLRRNVSPTSTSKAAASTVYGTLAASIDVTSIAQKVLEELYAPDPSSLFAIVSPVPPHTYFRPDDSRSYMLPSPLSEARPWEGPTVVPLAELGAGVRQYEAWCRHTQPPNMWQPWGIPILIALFTLLLVLLVLVAAWIQRAQYFQTQQQMADADRLRMQRLQRACLWRACRMSSGRQ
ncbi:unnamed protein product [Closterium sp. Yama58-4]|nr:unnamed protein product [Closterium sp. Yama58-4]